MTAKRSLACLLKIQTRLQRVNFSLSDIVLLRIFRSIVFKLHYM